MEIRGVRDTLRAQEYISPDNVSPHATLKGDILDKELIHFDDKACNNMDQYMRSVRDGHGFGHSRLVPCFVTPQDRDIYNDITNKTKQDIASAIDHLLVEMEELGDDEAILLKVIFIREIKGRNHSEYVAFHDEVFDSLQLLRAQLLDPEVRLLIYLKNH